jgi:peroxiredoxin/predicted negative regulator of RcsB-dependent stress response
MISFILFFVLFLIFAPISDAISISLGDNAPDFSLNSVEGEATTLDEYKGQTLVVIFWRTDQKKSLQALQEAGEIFEKYKQKGIKVVAVVESSDNMEDAQKTITDNVIKYPLFIDNNRQAYSDYGIRVFPTTLVIDKEGILVYDIPSHPLTYKIKLEGYIRKLIGEIDEDELKAILSPKKKEKDDALLEAERNYNLSMNFVTMRLMDKAIDAAVKSAEAKPEFIKAHILLGFLYLDDGEADLALEAFNNALKIEPDSKDAKTGKGGALILKNEVDSAIELLNEAAVANPYAPMTYYELGKAYEHKDDKDNAIDMYKKSIEKIIHKKILPSSVSKCQ